MTEAQFLEEENVGVDREGIVCQDRMQVEFKTKSWTISSSTAKGITAVVFSKGTWGGKD